MQTGNKIKSLWKELRFRYKLSIFNENTLAMVWEMRISKLSAILIVVFASICIGAITISLLTGTPLRRALPGYISSDMRGQIVNNALSVDSLSRIVNINGAYLDNMANILSGRITFDSVELDRKQPLLTFPIDSLLPASTAAKSFMQKYKEESKYSLDVFSQNVAENIILYPPVKGRTVRRFDPQRGHYGIRIAPERKSGVAAALGGTVIATYLSMEYDYVIEVQHSNNYISIYLYNSQLLKSVGDKVEEGENIALTNDRAEGNNRPFVEFQLWHTGIPLDPSEYIRF